MLRRNGDRTVSAALTESRTGVCWDCGGPCLTYKGTVHGWRCRACLDEHLAADAARYDGRAARDRAKRALKFAELAVADARRELRNGVPVYLGAQLSADTSDGDGDGSDVDARGGGGSGSGPRRSTTGATPASSTSHRKQERTPL